MLMKRETLTETKKERNKRKRDKKKNENRRMKERKKGVNGERKELKESQVKIKKRSGRRK